MNAPINEDKATRATYRYLRLGLIAAGVLLGTSILLEQRAAPGDCWQTSISAYYYTPVRAVFVGALLAIGICLIVIKGGTRAEDLCLNIAGMFAPVVALVPTSDHGACWSLPPQPLPTFENADGDKELSAWVLANIDNNIEALLWAGFLSLVTAGLIAWVAIRVGRSRRERRSYADLWDPENQATVLSLLLVAVVILVGALAFAFWDGFNERAHGFAAVIMIGAMAVAAIINACECFARGRRNYGVLYGAIAASMTVTALLLFGDWGWDHKVLVVEFIEILLFSALWAVQTRELWHNTVRTPLPKAPPDDVRERQQPVPVG